ncbi:MAG TPA: hypothetical protein PLU30_26690 [Verrucomicrobiae bacterium]|nr:hypothetical protein [Verrucomicrobiae bacterium]
MKMSPCPRLILAALLVPFLTHAQQPKMYTLEAKFIQMPTNAVIRITSDAPSATKDSVAFGPNVEVRSGDKTVIRTRGPNLDIDATFRGLDVLSAPRVSAWAGQEAIISIGAEPPDYFVPTKDGTYRLEKMKEGPGTSLKSIINAVPGEPNRIVLDLKYRVVEIEGRQTLPGVDLPVGQPIMRERAITAQVVPNLNDWICLGGGVIPGDKAPSPNDLLVFVRVAREESQPKN